MKSKLISIFNIDHFVRIAGLMCLMNLFIFILFHHHYLNTNNADPGEDISQIALQLIGKIENRVAAPYKKDIMAIATQPVSGGASGLYETWIKSHPSALALTILNRSGEKSEKIIRPQIWQFLDQFNITGQSKQDLIQYLVNSKTDMRMQPFFQTLKMNDITLFSVQCQDTVSSRIVEGRFLITNLDSKLNTATAQYPGVTVLHRDGYLIWTNEKIVNQKIAPAALNLNQTIYKCPFNTLPWILCVVIHGSATPAGSDISLFPWIAALMIMIVSVLSAAAVTYWIDLPLKPFYDTVMEISRGNFKLRLPEQKNKSTNRLARLINYMVEEMDYIQRINVGQIINEKNKTETILRNIADGVIVMDTEDKILVFNSMAEQWFRVTETEVLHKKISKVFHQPELLEMFDRIKKGEMQASSEFKFRVLDTGELKIFQAHAASIFSQENQMQGIVTVLRDVTKARETEQVKTELVSIVAHELKSPLTSIQGYSELLFNSGIESIKGYEYCKVIMAESTRLTNFVNKFLNLSRLESGKTQLHKAPIDMEQIIRKIVKTYRQMSDKKDIQVVLQIPKRLPLASGDEAMIEQVVLNLFSNAVKYSPPKSKIGMEIKEENSHLLVNVIDNGYGIPQSDLNKIFNKFYRVRDEEERGEDGSGLGLALVKEIIERHQGTVSVKSSVGVGSVFSFSLPLFDVDA